MTGEGDLNSADLGGGNDTITATVDIPIDAFDGGAGVDTFIQQDAFSQDINLEAGTVDGAANSLTNFENFTGNTGDDTITGTIGDGNILLGGVGDDEIHGLDGNDTIDGGVDDDTIDGGGDDDSILGGSGNDSVLDGRGDDSVDLGEGDDYVKAGGGADSYDGGADNDFIDYFDSANGVNIDLAANTVTGSWANNDTAVNFEGGGGSDTGDDTISGTSGANIINGNGGNDRVFDLRGDDSVNLGAGNDYVRAGGGADTYDGGADDDYISYYDSSNGVDIDFAANTATGSWANNDVVLNFEGGSGSGTGDDTFRGTDGANIIRTYGGDDDVYDRGGDDKIELGSGNDYVRVGGGQDSYDGGSGTDDYISYYDSTGGVNLDLEANTATSSWANNDTIENFESAGGSNVGDDTISGTSGANRIKTYGGDDRVFDSPG